jgi:hypothetical protein
MLRFLKAYCPKRALREWGTLRWFPNVLTYGEKDIEY